MTVFTMYGGALHCVAAIINNVGVGRGKSVILTKVKINKNNMIFVVYPVFLKLNILQFESPITAEIGRIEHNVILCFNFRTPIVP